MTERLIGRSDTQVGYSDPVIHNGMVIAQEIKVTLGMDCCPFLLSLKYLFDKRNNRNKNWVNCKDLLLFPQLVRQFAAKLKSVYILKYLKIEA